MNITTLKDWVIIISTVGSLIYSWGVMDTKITALQDANAQQVSRDNRQDDLVNETRNELAESMVRHSDEIKEEIRELRREIRRSK